MRLTLIIYLFFIFFSTQTYAQVYKWIDESGRTHFSDNPNPATLKKTSSTFDLQPQTILKKNKNSHVNKVDPIKNSNVIKIRKGIRNKAYMELNTLLSKLDSSYQKGEISEDTLITAYRGFQSKGQNHEVFYNNWIKSTPSYPQPYLAKGVYYYWKAWESRGNKSSSRTKDSEFEKFHNYLKTSKEQLEIALHMKEKSLPTHYYLLNIAISSNERNSVTSIFKAALHFHRSSYLIRNIYLKHLTPRWGGSVEEMNEFILNSSKDFNHWKKLEPLKGYIAREAGDIAAIDKNLDKAHEYYTMALTTGNNDQVLFARGKNHTRKGRFNEAIQDLSDAILLNPEKPDYYYWRSKAHLAMGLDSFALNDLNIAIKLDPYDNYFIKKHREIISKSKKEAYKINTKVAAEKLINELSSRIKNNKNDSVLHHQRAKEYYKISNFNLALKDIKTAIHLSPDEYELYTFIDYILFENRDLDQIIRYWNQYIRRNPEDDRAYLELAGTYSQKGDFKSAMRFSKISSDLGNSEGFYAYNRFKEIVTTSNN